ncbi:hypothetical protein IF650_03520 [Cellulosimicrobium terreum]|nr:hypothetical protein [Cellulosimicrobium terreum]
MARELLAPWSPPATAALLWLVAVGLLAPTVLTSLTGTGLARWQDLPYAAVALLLAVTTALGIVTVVLDVPRSARLRSAVREQWHPGDPEAQ